MNRFVTAIAITSTLLLTQSCSSSSKSGEAHAEHKHSAPEHHMGNTEHEHSPMADMEHEEHSAIAQTTQAKLTVPSAIAANTPVPLVIDIQDSAGKAIANFDTFQEKLMHLIVVSDDFQFFSHLHPTYKENGRFEVEATFPQPGGYTIFSDYKPAGQKEQVSVLKAQIPGTRSAVPAIDLNQTKTFGDTKVNLTVSEPSVKAGREVTLKFDLWNVSSNQPISDLQPYLGERGHLVILKQSSPLTRTDYIHAHALKNTPDGQVHFSTRFPQPGKYKLWGQFNRNGTIVTADFWVNVR